MTARHDQDPPAGTGQQVRQEAGRVGQHATRAGGQVAHAAAEQGGQVAAETRRQARHLTGEASTLLREQAQTQQQRAADGLRGLGRELGSMANRGEGPAGDLVRRAADAAQQAAGWLDEREPGAVLDEVRGYARRHPGTFLAGAAVAGLLVGRLTRNLTSTPDGGGPTAGGAPGGAGAFAPAREEPGPMAGIQPPEPTIEAPYRAESAYTGVARVRNASPPDRPEPEIPGGVAP